MIVIHGTNHYGTVDERAGQWGQTRFFHVYFLPIVPLGAMWIVDGGSHSGHDMQLSARSVAAAYGRTWGPLAGAICLVVGGIGPVIGAVACFAFAALTWSWRVPLGKRAQRQGDFNQRAFRTRCDPRHMPKPLVQALGPVLDEHWAAVSEGQSPSDVARFGTDDPQRAAVAYGVLRLAALSLPKRDAADAMADAMRIVDDQREVAELGDGHPYRASKS